MSSRYQLPCRCGTSVTVSAGQAGGQVRCGCGTMLDVPEFRDLRKLTPVTASDEPTVASPSGQITSSRVAFVLCCVTLVIAAGVAALAALQRSTIVISTHSEIVKLDEEAIDKMSIDTLWSVWNTFKTGGLHSMADNNRAEALRAREYLAKVAQKAMIIAVVALVGAIGFGAVAAQRGKQSPPT